MDDNSNFEEAFKNKIFKMKPIYFQDRSTLICMQSENGPCPLIAILNYLLLSGDLSLECNTEFITGEDMVNHILNFILEKNNEDGYLELILQHFKELQTGLMVNVRFSSVLDFEECSRLHIFDYLGIKLYHGWLMDPQSTPEYETLKNYTYDQAAEYSVQDNNTLSFETKQFLEDFINTTQLTYHGIYQLSEAMKERELGIIFHNNHFSIIYKRNAVYLLLTDIGYSEKPELVWQLLNSINGDTEFVNENFQPIQSSYNNALVEDPDYELAKKLTMDDDYILAMELQEKEHEENERQRYTQPTPPEPVLSRSRASSDDSHNVTKERVHRERQKDWSCALV